MPNLKRPRANSHLESINLVFGELFALSNNSQPADDIALSILKKLKLQLLSTVAEEENFIRKTAKEFTLEDAVQDFDLTYSTKLSKSATHGWKIEELPDVKISPPSACLVSLLDNYTGIYDRSSGAACRTAVDFIICECIGVMQGGISPTPNHTKDGRRTPTPWDTVKVHCEVSFTHTINRTPTISQTTVVGGRVDHGIGLVIRSKKAPNRLFHSLLLCIEGKFHGSLFSALTQLVVYLACLRQSRINRGRSNTSVYGVATDGLSYVFMNITHEGVLKQSKQFDVMRGELSDVLGCLRYILEMAMSMTPISTPEKGGLKKSDELEADADDPYTLDDTSDDEGHL